MDLDVVLAVVGLLGLAVAALSARMQRIPVSEPLLGLLAGMILGREVTGWLTLSPVTEDHRLLHEATRLLLAISVMSVALRYPIRDVRRRVRSVALLLLVAMPVMALTTTGLGWAVMGLPLASAALLGAALCPTDPVLASSVVTGKPAEDDLPARDRQLLSLESGSNDGLALPLVLAAIAGAGALTAGEAAAESVWQVFGAVVIGGAAGWLGARALVLGEEHGATDPAPVLLFTVVLALSVLGAAGLANADGVLAVFVAGLAYNAGSTGRERAGAAPIDEAVNRFAVLPLFVLLGASIPWQEWEALGWQGPALVVAVLLLRRLPVLLLLRRPLRLPIPDALYLGWFGPVGVSALFYLTLEADRLAVDPEVLAAGSLVVVGSTVAHGLSGSPGRVLYRRVTRAGARSAAPGDVPSGG